MKRTLPLLLLVALAAGCNSAAETPRDDLQRFVDQIRQKPPAEAMADLRGIARRPSPEAKYAMYELGNMFYAMAEDSAAARGPNDAEAKALLDSAQTWFEAAVAADSTFLQAWVNLGGVWDDRADMMAPQAERKARTEKAVAMYQRALAIDPADERARCNLGALYLRDRKKERAKEAFTTVLEQNPKSALGHYHLAVLFAESEIYREAEREWELAVKYDRDGDIGERSRANLEIVKELRQGAAAPPAAAGH